MIVKERKIPEINLQLEALLKRRSEATPGRERILAEYNKRNAGIKGEQKLDYYLSYLDEKEYLIFHGLRLKTENYYFQIDTLLLTSRVAYILEVKYWPGTITFDPDYDQLVRTLNEKDEAFQDPLSQAEHQRRQLKKWLCAHGFPQLPIEFSVVFSHPSTIIKSTSKSAYICKKVFHSHRLIKKINDYEQNYTSEKLTQKEIKKLSRLLFKSHVDKKIDILKFFNISQSEVLTGVHCPECSALPMIFYWGKWHCPTCKATSATAHHQAVRDYFLLVKPTMTNAEFRSFTHIDQVNTATKLLIKMGLPYSGEKRHRVYLKPQ